MKSREIAEVERLPEQPIAWLAVTARRPYTRWEDWTTRSSERAGELIAPPSMG